MGLQTTFSIYIITKCSYVRHTHTLLSLYKTPLLLSIQYITDLASCFGALPQTTLRVSIWKGTFELLGHAQDKFGLVWKVAGFGKQLDTT